MAGGKNKLSREEELLLQDFSRNVSTKSSALFYGNALIVSAIPIWLFWRIHQMDLYQSAVFFVLGTIVSTYLVALAYRNVKFVLKHKVAVQREEAVTQEVMKQLADDKRTNRKDKDERILWKKNEVADYEATTFSIFYNNALFLVILWKKNEVADYEATTFSIFYNNALFLVLLLVLSFFVLKTFNPALNYVASIGSAAGLLALFSTSQK
ncbi:hypothetical protein ACOMHN_010262 [Nucella lapillus]